MGTVAHFISEQPGLAWKTVGRTRKQYWNNLS